MVYNYSNYIFMCNAAQSLQASEMFLSSLNEVNISPVPKGDVGVCQSSRIALPYIFVAR